MGDQSSSACFKDFSSVTLVIPLSSKPIPISSCHAAMVLVVAKRTNLMELVLANDHLSLLLVVL